MKIKYKWNDFESYDLEAVEEYIAENAYYVGEERLLEIIENEIEIVEVEND